MLHAQNNHNCVYIATGPNDRSELITEKRHISFVVRDEQQLLQAFDRLIEAGIVEEIFADDDEEMTPEELEGLKEGLEDIRNGRVFPIEQLWELARE